MIFTVLWWTADIMIGILGIYIITMNWYVFCNNYLLRNKWISAIPLIGAFLAMAFLFFCPFKWLNSFFWLPWIIDWGSLPLLLVSIFIAARNQKSTK